MHRSSSTQEESVSPEILLAIIKTQTEIARLGLDLGGVIAFVAEYVKDLVGADGAVVELVEDNEMIYRAATGNMRNQLGLRLKRVGSLSGLCVQMRQILRCDDTECDVRVNRDACRRVGIRSMIVAPLCHHENAVGVLKVASPHPNAFNEQDVAVLALVCDLIASAMYRAAQFETNELYHQATHDSLTGLVNRALFYDRLRQCIDLAQRQRSNVGVLVIDMDGLKSINDTWGHKAGDAALRELGRRITALARKSDTVARLGGDEFAVIMSNIDHQDSVLRHASVLCEHIGQPFTYETNELYLGASIGHSTFPHDGDDPESLVDKADQVMYLNKRQRRCLGIELSSLTGS